MNLGGFSISLTVKNLEESIAFYEKLGFTPLGGTESGEGWMMLKNGEHVIGLFEGMFEKNMLTFNPGWNQSAEEVDEFTDVREIREQLKERGIDVVSDDAQGESGPGSILVEDPDGNPILIDQHR
ncbi:MAG: VOC family protein [Verrucomicrobiota bacterium]